MRGLQEYIQVSRRFGLRTHHEVILLSLLLSATLFESIGLAMLLPIVEFIQSDGGKYFPISGKFIFRRHFMGWFAMYVTWFFQHT